ncbi:SH3 domain-containing protein [Bradyrhizobium sp. CCGUVB1N3]|uniref:SH3 domain-containing protein n=1 Tax=Bradyrhizobium sp. CCGUVB1N3 TaxID=2949629 RepID=UPI0020B230C0|nr:SH3 domain-containing protein [Bradyrhizobium sp. CCGUVB1N3]MCP3473903.1 SH3 domain-containing protein [Bradyrhizobium sp. CCGUVB1N3]
MNRKIRFAVLGIGVAWCLSTAAAVAATVDTSGVTACALSGWSNDPDPSGLNIRAAPRADAEIIGHVPPAEAQAGDRYAAEFRITGSRNGWFLVSRVKFADYGSGKGDRILFGGPGWVFADKVRFVINRAEVRAAPAESAQLLATLRTTDGGGGPDSATIDHVFGCSGAFAEAAVHMEGQRQVRGWVTGICSNQVTTCP